MNIFIEYIFLKMSKNKTRTKDKYRVVYNDTQRIQLENEFRSSEYITIPRKQEIAQKLQLSERQIKIWFQNRRAKKRKQQKRRSTTATTTTTYTPIAAAAATTTTTTNITNGNGCGNMITTNNSTTTTNIKAIDNSKSIYKQTTYTSPIATTYRPHSYIYDSSNDSQQATKRKSPSSHLSLIPSPSSPTTPTPAQTQLHNHLQQQPLSSSQTSQLQPSAPVKPPRILTQPSWQQNHQQQAQAQQYQFQQQQQQQATQSEVFYDAIDSQNIHAIQGYHTQQDTYNYYNYSEPYQQQYPQQYYQQHYQE